MRLHPMRSYILGLLLLAVLINPSIAATDISGSYTDTSNQIIEYRDLPGPVLIEAFSTTCSHCIDQHPQLVKFYDTYQDNVTLITVSIDENDNLTTLMRFNDSYPSSWSIGMDDGNLADMYNIRGTPTLLIFDDNGLAACSVGTKTSDELGALVDNYFSNPESMDECEGSGNGLIFYAMVLGTMFLIFTLFRDMKKRKK